MIKSNNYELSKYHIQVKFHPDKKLYEVLIDMSFPFMINDQFIAYSTNSEEEAINRALVQIIEFKHSKRYHIE